MQITRVGQSLGNRMYWRQCKYDKIEAFKMWRWSENGRTFHPPNNRSFQIWVFQVFDYTGIKNHTGIHRTNRMSTKTKCSIKNIATAIKKGDPQPCFFLRDEQLTDDRRTDIGSQRISGPQGESATSFVGWYTTTWNKLQINWLSNLYS